MGYRSEVSFCIAVKDVEGLVALMKVDGREIFKDFMQYMHIVDLDREGHQYLFFHSDSWKWYEDSVIGFHELLALAGNLDSDYKAKFVRVGEETNDMEEARFNDYDYDLEYPSIERRVETGDSLFDARKVTE